jgi:hypothetical protein
MKTISTITFLILMSVTAFSQSKTEFGITTEGAWFMPHQNYGRDWSTKAGFGTGIGVYASRNIFWRFSADIGITYRYKQMQQHYVIYPENGGSNYNTGYTITTEGWGKYGLDYFVVPVHLQLLYRKYAFIRGGIEASWLTNYNVGRKKTEYNWTVGIGSQKHKLKWSVNYIRGFKEVGFMNGLYEIEIGNVKYKSATAYRNQMLQLNLSYPIWQK